VKRGGVEVVEWLLGCRLVVDGCLLSLPVYKRDRLHLNDEQPGS
jgi:hypothetical protein